jgi:LysR family transcriptional regulator, glycine cleavage system transcriptional activator
MNRRSLPLTALRGFTAAALHASISRAAEELGVTPGAISRQIATLEAITGVPLVLRGQPLGLTEDGQALFDGVAPAFDRIEATMVRLTRTSRPMVLAVNAPPTFTMRWLIPRLSAFQRGHRDAEVRLTTGSTELSGAAQAELDVVIRRLPAGAPRDGVARPFLSGALVAVCAPGLLRSLPVAAPADVLRHALIEAATNMTNWDAWLARAGLSRPDPSRFLRFEEMFFALQAALDGLGIALVPLSLVADDLAAGRLASPLGMAAIKGRDYAYTVCASTRNPALAQDFGDWLVEQGHASDQVGVEVMQSQASADDGST